MKVNKIPKGLVSLENLSNRHDQYLKQKGKVFVETFVEYDKVNIGTKDDPKIVCIGKFCSQEDKRLISLLTRYRDVFTWRYVDLKKFKNGEFQHKIPLKLGATRYKQKQ